MNKQRDGELVVTDDNPYAPPKAEVSDIAAQVPGSGSLSVGIAGRYEFSILDVVAEGWRRTRGFKGAFWGAMAGLGSVVIGLSVLFGVLGLYGAAIGPWFQWLPDLLFSSLLYPFVTGVLMMGVYHVVGLPIRAGLVFGFLGESGRVLVVALLTTLLTDLGFLLLILPGIYLTVAWSLSIPLLVDKRLGPWQAMEASRKAITRHWFKVAGLYLVMLGVLIAGLLSVVGLIWALPMVTLMFGILYRTIFGVEGLHGGVR